MDPTTSNLKREDVLLQIRDKLRRDNIKLWLQPYYSEIGGANCKELKTLAESYFESINTSLDLCFEKICELQNLSLENLKQNDRFKQSGVATIKIKILHPNSPPRVLTKELLLSLRVTDVKDLITKEINVTHDRLKLIHAGKVLNDPDNLSSQGVKNGQQILAITLAETPTEVQDTENRFRELEGIKTDSRLLASDNDYLQLEDQFGNAVNIPKEERKALVVAMTLHEKGRAALKRNDYSRALIFLLEADEEFKNCNSQLLKSVDNYALLDLDIAWCYLCVQSVAHLPEAFERLTLCEERFHQSYGPNLERVIALKGATGNEACLYMRLHLLQAIVLYHKNRRGEAVQLLKKARDELNVLKVNEDDVMLLLELGYTTAEARLGLRAEKGNVDRAANFIKENRDKRKESRQKAIAEEILNKKRKKLGKCIDGKQYVDPNFVTILVNMGYNFEASRNALKNTNNIISDAIQFIQENPQPGPSQSKSFEFLSLINDLVPELVSAGFDPTMAKMALHKNNADIIKAAEELLANQGIIDGDFSILNLSADSLEKVQAGSSKKQEELDNEKVEAYKRLAEDITMVDDDHLDLTLEQEEQFLNQYLFLLE